MLPCSYDVYVMGRLARGAVRGTGTPGPNRPSCPWAGPHWAVFDELAGTDVENGIVARSKVHICRQCRMVAADRMAREVSRPVARCAA